MDELRRFSDSELLRFCTESLSILGVPPTEAEITAKVLVYADLRGIDSHGVAHLKRYVRAIQHGAYTVEREIAVVHQTPSTALVDGGNGIGYPVAVRSMELAIEKARTVGSSCVATRNSHHFGAAGYYASMALTHDMIGFCITNAGPAVVPTFGIQGQCGTNPIALAVPAGTEPPFVLDMATSVKATGKIETLIRDGQEAPSDWILQADGSTGGDPERFLDALINSRMGGQLPLGGQGELASGYKGYGLGLGIELLAPILAGDIASPFMKTRREGYEATIAHFFGAIRIDAFRPAAEFKADVDRIFAHIKASPRVPGNDRIWVAGEKEFVALQERSELGIPLREPIIDELGNIAGELDIEPVESM